MSREDASSQEAERPGDLFNPASGGAGGTIAMVDSNVDPDGASDLATCGDWYAPWPPTAANGASSYLCVFEAPGGPLGP